MNASTITVHWHNDTQPIYAVNFQPKQNGPSDRLVTGGGDNNVRMWKVHVQPKTPENPQNPTIQYLSTLRKHTQAVNVVRFDPSGEILASAGDDGTLILWKLADGIIKELDDDDDDEPKESWRASLQLRSSTSEINDICWSPNSQYVVTGSMDNTLRIYQLEEESGKLGGKLVDSFKYHSHYVQGVFWDPQNEYIASQSADRSVHIYKITTGDNNNLSFKLYHRFTKLGSEYMYHSETLQSFFRRLCFSPDGNFLVTPAGKSTKKEEKSVEKKEVQDSEEKGDSDQGKAEAVYVYSRSSLNSSPIFQISGLNKPAIAISFSPKLYVTKSSEATISALPYKMVFAIGTQDSVLVYDTDTFRPLGYVSNLHYSSITDLNWDVDGSKITVSSTDGFCSVITFEEGLFGEIYHGKIHKAQKEEVNDDMEVDEKEELRVENGEVQDKKEVKVEKVKPIDQFYKPKEKKRVAPTLVTDKQL